MNNPFIWKFDASKEYVSTFEFHERFSPKYDPQMVDQLKFSRSDISSFDQSQLLRELTGGVSEMYRLLYAMRDWQTQSNANLARIAEFERQNARQNKLVIFLLSLLFLTMLAPLIMMW